MGHTNPRGGSSPLSRIEDLVPERSSAPADKGALQCTGVWYVIGVSSESGRLFSAAARVEQALERERALRDQDEAIELLVAVGRELHDTLGGVLADDKLWQQLRREAEQPRLDDQQMRSLELLAGHEAAGALLVLGYEPPPPVGQLIDETLAAYATVLALDPAPEVRAAQLDAAFDALAAFQTRLHALLDDTGLLPPAKRRGLLRRMLRGGARVALVIAPVAAGWGAYAAAHALGLPADVMKDVVIAFTTPLSNRLLQLLPSEPSAEAAVQPGELVDDIPPVLRMRVLATVVASLLQHCLARGGQIGHEDRERLRANWSRARVAIELLLPPTAELQQRLDAFDAELDHGSAASAWDAWQELEQTLDAAPIDAPADATSNVTDDDDAEQQRDAARERQRETTLEKQERLKELARRLRRQIPR